LLYISDEIVRLQQVQKVEVPENAVIK
jgi:hypothetical protein